MATWPFLIRMRSGCHALEHWYLSSCMFISCQNLQVYQWFWLSNCSFTRLQQIEMAPEAGRMSGNLLIQDRPSVPNMPASQITQLNPEVRNRNLLNTMFKVSLKDEMYSGYVMTRNISVPLSVWFWWIPFQFKKDAPLRQFIHDITKVQKNYYSLAEMSIAYDFMII